jgi:hypothetical protein
MKYKAIIELDEDRNTCMECPFCDADDNCELQDLGNTETWSEQLVSCPLESVKEIKTCKWHESSEWEEDIWFTECGNAQVFTSGGVKQNNYKYCPYCGKEIEESEGEK